MIDRGLQYGDGVFETIAVHDGRALRLERHLARLADGCRRLGFAAPDVRGDIAAALRGSERAVLKLIVTRGEGGRGYRPPSDPEPRTSVSLYPWPAHADRWSEDGIAVRWCETRLARQPALAGIKHLNRLEQVLARAEWRDDDVWQEGLMLDTDGNVVEATQSNLFLVQDGALRTPRVDACGVAGIIRSMVIERFQCEETAVSRDDVAVADEAFVCNSVIGIVPVRRVGERALASPGPVTAGVRRWFREEGGR